MKHLFAFALPDAGLKPLALNQVRRSSTDNDFLLSDRTDIEVDGAAIAVADTPAALSVLKAIAYDMGAKVREETDTSLFIVWRSPIIGFPNAAYAYVVDGKVSLYGKARFGRRDFGANRSFIETLAAGLKPG